MSDSQEAVRLFVGGLPTAVTAQQLTGRFTSFGSVSDVAIVPSKFSGGASVCRGFAYVSFTPKDGMALQRCLSLYNGCKWLGGILRVERSREHYLSKLQQEWQTPPEQVLDAAGLVQPDSADPVRIPTPASSFVKRKLMTVQANKVKRIFAPIKGKQLSALSWDPPPDPPAVLKRKAAEQAAVEFSRKRMALPGPPPLFQETSHTQSDEVPQSHAPNEDAAAVEHSVQKPDSQQQNSNPQQQHSKGAATDHTAGAAQQTQDEAVDQASSIQPASSSSSEAGIVDFMSDDDDMAGQSADAPIRPAADREQNSAVDMSRFSSDDESADEAQHAQQVYHAKQAQQAKYVSEATSEPQHSNLTRTMKVTEHDTTAKLGPTIAADLSRFDSDDEPSDAARQSDGALKATAQPTAPAVAAQVADNGADLSRFDSDSDSDNGSASDAGPSAVSPYGRQVDVGMLEADVNLQSTAIQSGTSSKDPHAQASASQPASHQAASLIKPSHPAVASQPFHQPEAAALVAMTQQPQEPHQAPDVQLATSCKTMEALASDEADSSSDKSDDLESDTHLLAAHLEQAPADLRQLGSPTVAYECAQQDAAQQSHPSSTSPSELSSEDAGTLQPEQSDYESRHNVTEEQQSSGLSSDLEPTGSGDQEPGHQQEQMAHDHLHEGNTTDESDAVSQAATSSGAIESHHEDVQEGATQVPVEVITQAAGSAAHQQEAPTYPDLSVLKFGASFWRQHEAVSQRDWQAQRQVLQADFRAKRRAAIKHTHRKRKAARS